MDVFVTGASGYVGSEVATAFARAGHCVHGLVRSAAKCRALAVAEVQPVLGSIEDATSWEAVARRCEVLIHCAVQYTSQMFEFDRRAVSALLRIASGKRESSIFIYTSGVWLYGDTAGTVVDEESPVNPAELVRERVEIEDSVLATRRDGLRPIAIRVGCVYGTSGSLTATWFDTAHKHGSARIVGDGSNRWAMVHVHDLADLYLRAAESDASGEVFNATDRSRSTVFECARAASFAAGAKGRVEKVSLEQARNEMGLEADCLTLDQNVDSRKAITRLGWLPRHPSFVDGVDRYFAAWHALQKH